MKQDPTRAFLVRVIVISALATFVWGACFVAICVFVLWAAQSLAGGSGVLRNAHLWFEYPTSAVGDLPGPSHRLEAHLVLEARVEKLNDALGAGFVR